MIDSEGHLVTTSVLRQHANEENHEFTGREFWLHRPTGYVWALQLDRAGRVTAAAGPLAKPDAEPLLLDYFLYKSTDVPWIERHGPEFVRLDSVSRRAA